MNPISGMLAGAKIASTALPIIFGVATHLMQHLPDIEAKFADLEAKLAKAFDDAKHLDINSAKEALGAAWADGMSIYDAIGLPRENVMDVIATASKDNKSAGFTAEATAVAEGLAKKLGLAV